MANHASALKRNRQNQRRRVINRMNRQKLRSQLKKFRMAIFEGKGAEARQMLPQTFSLIDKSVQKGVIKRNAAGRYKSRLNRNVNAVPS